MRWGRRWAVLLIAFAALAHAQERGTLTARLAERAPELVDLAGSMENFESLVSGLATVSPVRLSTNLGNGYTEFVRFTPPGAPLSEAEILRVLRAARDKLRTLNVREPKAAELAAALMGGIIRHPAGMRRLRGTLPDSGLGFEQNYTVQTVHTGLERFAGSAENLEALLHGLTSGAPITLRGTGVSGPPETVSFSAGVPPTTRAEALNLLRAADRTLQAYGVPSPTPHQIRAALLGGTIRARDGRSLELVGALDPRAGLPRGERYPP